MKRFSAIRCLILAASLFASLIITSSFANAANEVTYTISPKQEQNYQEYLQLLRTLESPEKDQLIRSTVQIHEAMLRQDHYAVIQEIHEVEELVKRLPVSDRRALDRFVDTHEVREETGAAEPPKGSCTATCPNGSCSANCDPSELPWCACVAGDPVCLCKAGTPTTTQWGQIILVALLVGCGAFIIVRRKRRVPAAG